MGGLGLPTPPPGSVRIPSVGRNSHTNSNFTVTPRQLGKTSFTQLQSQYFQQNTAIEFMREVVAEFLTTPEETMLEKILRLYAAYMMQDVRSPTPHLAGPPGVGKSTVVQQAANILGVKLHILNVARMSPLEIEGIQMPVDENQRLKMLHSTIWTSLKEGDIVLLDEFMRGFPEVYNGLLDIMTSRQVAGFHLPKVFFIAASNSVAAYDRALEDRLLHIPVADIRKSARAKGTAMKLFVDEAGLLPATAISTELHTLFDTHVLPMYNVLDQFTGRGSKTSSTGSLDGHSVRKLLGQLKLREVQVEELRDVVEVNNRIATQQGKAQFVVLLTGKNPDPQYLKLAKALPLDRLTQVQRQNHDLNLELIEMENMITHQAQEGIEDDDIFI